MDLVLRDLPPGDDADPLKGAREWSWQPLTNATLEPPGDHQVRTTTTEAHAKETKRNLFVGNLHEISNISSIQGAFSRHGKVEHVSIPQRGHRPTGTGTVRGIYCHIRFETEAEADTALTAMNKADLDGSTIVVKRARVKEAEKPPPSYLDKLATLRTRDELGDSEVVCDGSYLQHW